MPLDGSDVASKPAGTTAAPNTTIESAKYNSVVNDIYAILNTVRTLAKGFTGASTAIGALDNFNTVSSDIASAATTDLSTATGVAATITGTTTIASFGTCSAGVYRVLTFESALTITHGANIVLPGNADLNVAAGDIVVMRSEGAGVWHLENYQPKEGYLLSSDSADFATAAQGTKADNAMPKSGGTFTGDVTLNADPDANLKAATKQYVDTGDATQIGVSQTWQNVTASRAAGTAYHNTTGKPIIVNITANGGGAVRYVQVSADNITFVNVSGHQSTSTTSSSTLIPDTYYYKTDANFDISNWAELR